MVSFQTPKSPNQRKTILEFDNSSKKRKREESEADENNTEKLSKDKNPKPSIDTGLHLKRPSPLEWQRCLNIQSGQLHLDDTRSPEKRTRKDHRQSPEAQSHPSHMSLELELNLPYESLTSHVCDNWTKPDNHCSLQNSEEISNDAKHQQLKNLDGLKRSPSWVTLEEDHQEMVAAACMRCHMLVMLCKSSPSCPNCKFMHPPNQSPPNLFKVQTKIRALML